MLLTRYHIHSAVCLFVLKFSKGKLRKSASMKTIGGHPSKETSRLTTNNLKITSLY